MTEGHRHKLRLIVTLLIVGLGLVPSAGLGLGAAPQSNPQAMWTIGRFDESSAEFHVGAAPSPAPVYVIGKSQPGKDWYAFLDLRSAWQCTAMEANQQSLPLAGGHGFRFDIKPHQIITVRVNGTSRLPASGH